jgi:hypothetical protein
MSTVVESVDVAVPVQTAYNQWTQFEEFPRFMEGVESIQQVSDTRTHWRVSIGGVSREFDAEITEQHPDDRVAWKSHTRVTLQLDTVPEGIVEQLGDKLGLVSHRAKGDMRRFKDYIESTGGESGAYREDIQRPPTAHPDDSRTPESTRTTGTPEPGTGSSTPAGGTYETTPGLTTPGQDPERRSPGGYPPIGDA